MNKPKKSIQAQVKEDMPEFYDESLGLSVEQMDARLAQFAKDLEAIQDTKADDEALREASEKLSQLRAPYLESKKAVKLKSKYLIALIKEKGGK